jgi:hypothetical protein
VANFAIGICARSKDKIVSRDKNKGGEIFSHTIQQHPTRIHQEHDIYKKQKKGTMRSGVKVALCSFPGRLKEILLAHPMAMTHFEG